MEGENTIKVKKHFWSKPVEKRHKIYCTTGVHGICDESELEEKIKIAMDEYTKNVVYKNLDGAIEILKSVKNIK